MNESNGHQLAKAFLQTIDEHNDDGGPRSAAKSSDKPVKLATVDAAYSGSGRAAVLFDGETVAGGRTYVSLVAVKPNDRVVMLPQGHTYVIIGIIAGSAPYSWADSTERSGQVGMREGDVGTQRDTSVTYRRTSGAWVAWESNWITWAPTLTVGSGSGMTVANTSYKYKFISGALLLRFNFQVSAVGTAAGAIFLSLPLSLTNGGDCIGVSYDVSSGKMGRCAATSGSTVVEIAQYDNTTFIIAGHFLRGEIVLHV